MKLLYFSAGWCTPCTFYGPTMDKVAQSGIPVQKVDVDEQGDLTAKYGIRNVPTVVKVDEQGNSLGNLVGVKSEQQVKDFYNG